MTQDSLGNLFPITVTFTPGEQPSDAKLEGISTQTAAGLVRVSRAIGDLWAENTDNKLFRFVDRYSHATSLARLLGPASVLNPMVQGGDDNIDSGGTLIEAKFLASQIPVSSNEFSLREIMTTGGHYAVPALEYVGTEPERHIQVPSSGDIHTALNAVDSGVFLNYKTSRMLLSADGDYHIDKQGNIFTYKKTSSYGSSEKSYETIFVSDSYDGATYNVIPDLNESEILCSVVAEGEYYWITLPMISHLSSKDSSGIPYHNRGNNTVTEDFRAFLPRCLFDASGMNLGDDQQIPDGFIKLWDNSAHAFVANLTFFTGSSPGHPKEYCLKVTGATLTTGSSTYRIVTTGTTVAETLAVLRNRFFVHNHSDPQTGNPIKHWYLTEKHIKPSVVSTKFGFTVRSPTSQIEGNDHPQYLCRYGYNVNCDKGQFDNSMLGDLMMGAANTYTTDGAHLSDELDSRKICFGSASRYIFWDYGLAGGNKLVIGGMGLYLTGSGKDIFLADSAKLTLRNSTNSADIGSFETSSTTAKLSSVNTLLLFGGSSVSIQTSGPVGITSSTFGITASSSMTITCSGATLTASSSGISLNAYTGMILNSSTSYVQLTAQNSYIILDSNGVNGYTKINAETYITLDAETNITLDAADNIYLTAGSDGFVHINECMYLVIPHHTSAPAGSQYGAMYVDTDDHKLYVYTNAWRYVSLAS